MQSGRKGPSWTRTGRKGKSSGTGNSKHPSLKRPGQEAQRPCERSAHECLGADFSRLEPSLWGLGLEKPTFLPALPIEPRRSAVLVAFRASASK